MKIYGETRSLFFVVIRTTTLLISSGKKLLNTKKETKHGRTYILNYSYLYEAGKLKVIGYFSIAMKTMKIPVIETMSNSLRKKMGNLSDKEQNLVIYLIGQLGRDTSYPSNCLEGKKMLQGCYGLIGSARDIVGGRAILLECKPIEKLCRFYEEEGFIDITENGDGLKQYIRFIE